MLECELKQHSYFLGSQASLNSLLSKLKEYNATGRFWIGASDLEDFGIFKWFYSGKVIASTNWDDKGKPKNETVAKSLDQVYL